MPILYRLHNDDWMPMEPLDQLLTIVGKIVLWGGGLSLVVYQVFKRLASRWLDAKFDKRLQDLKHQHGKEIEQLRFKISALLDRTTKLHQREFEVLPEAWSKLNDGYWEVRVLVASVQSDPDINGMPEPLQEEFISTCELSEWQKAEVREAEDKNKRYQKYIVWHYLGKAEDKIRDTHICLRKNGIFLSDDIRAKFAEIDDLIWKVFRDHRMNVEHELERPERKLIDQFLRDDGDKLMKELEQLVHDRIWPTHDAVLDLPSITPSQDTSELKR